MLKCHKQYWGKNQFCWR